MRRNWLGYVVAVLAIGGAAWGGSLNLPLAVDETSGVARHQEPVTSGIPLPEALGLLDTARLGIFDPEGREVPAQFRVLSRWRGVPSDHGRPIKWLLVDFQADVPAGARVVYSLRDTGSGPAEPEDLLIADGPGGVSVSTGPMQFAVGRDGWRLFDQVYLQGRAMIQASDGTGAVLTEYRNSTHCSALAPCLVSVEEAGALRAVVKVEGTHHGPQGDLLRYVARITAWAGKPFVKVAYTLRNPDSYGYLRNQPAAFPHFREMHLGLQAQLSGNLTVSFMDHSFTLGGGEVRGLEQDMVGSDSSSYVSDQNYNIEDNFVRRIVDGDQNVLFQDGGEGFDTGRDPGFVDVSGGGFGVAAAVLQSWQNFPKALYASGAGHLVVSLWPEFGTYTESGYYQHVPVPAGAEQDYTFAGGRQKTHEVLYYFHTGNAEEAGVVRRVMAFHGPLMALAPPYWNARSGAVDHMIEERDWRSSSFPSELGAALHRFERFQSMKWNPAEADPVPTIGVMSLPYYRRRGGAYGGLQFYGWANFGDIPWADGWSSGHYDWAYSLLLHYLRTGERPLLDLGREMARHRADWDQYHTTADVPYANGGQRFEKGQRHGEVTVPPTTSHTWVGGLLLHHLITGDPVAKEAALEVADFYRGHWVRYGGPSYGVGPEARLAGWSLVGLSQLYEAFGDESLATIARNLIVGFRNLETVGPTSGYLVESDGHCDPWQFGIFLGGVGRYFFATGGRDEVALAQMRRTADWLISNENAGGPVLGGDGTPGSYRPYAAWYHWSANGERNDSPQRTHLAHFLDGLALTWLATGDGRYLDAAERYGGDLWRWWQKGFADRVNRADPASWSAITMRPIAFPGTESKNLGWLSRWGHTLELSAARRAVDPDLHVIVEPQGVTSNPMVIRIMVRGAIPPRLGTGFRRYGGRIRVDGHDVTAVFPSVAAAVRGTMEETWVLPVRWPAPGPHVIDVEVWSLTTGGWATGSSTFEVR